MNIMEEAGRVKLNKEKIQLIKKCVGLSAKSYIKIFSYKEMGFTTHEFIEYKNATAHILTSSRFIYIAFRGTDDIKDIINDAQFVKTKDDKHRGTVRYVDKIFDLINSELLKKEYAGKELVLVGHSLGADSAIEYSDRIKREIHLIVAIAPFRLGGKKFLRQYKHKSKLIVIMNHNDLVPLYPFVSMGYRDFDECEIIYFSKSGKVIKKPPLFFRIYYIFMQVKKREILKLKHQHEIETYLNLASHIL